MKYLRLSIFFLLFVLGISRVEAASEGKAAPEFQATLFNGEKFSLSAEKNKVVIIHYWATWCDACQAEMHLLEDYYKKHHDEGFEILAVNMDNLDKEIEARDFMKNYTFKAAFAKNSSYKSYGRIWRLPLNFVIDRKGILKKDGWVLKRAMTAKDLEDVVTPLLL